MCDEPGGGNQWGGEEATVLKREAGKYPVESAKIQAGRGGGGTGYDATRGFHVWV